MDCLRAQELVSDALDSVEVDSRQLAEAKSHCRECEDCRAFVRAQLAVRDAGLPTPPEDLADRIMTRVRAESAARSAASPVAARTSEPPTTIASLPSSNTPEPRPARTWTELAERAWAPKNRRALVAWGTAAAVLFVAAGIGAIAGVRAILVPNRVAETTVMGSVGEEAYDYGAAESAPTRDQEATSLEGDKLLAEGAPSFISVDGGVYRLIGPADQVNDGALVRIGATTSALDSGAREETYDVMADGDTSRVYVESDSDEWLAFERVARTYAGRLYALQSGDIKSFGTWPTLPDGIDEPSSADGSPTFEPDGADDAGTTIYRLRGSTSDQGIALGPNAPAGDPLAGSPEWSWWKPVE